MIDDPNIEYEPNQEFDENGEPIFYIEKDYTADEFTSYNFNEEPPAFPDSYYESVWDTGTEVSALADNETTGEELTDRIELEDELKDSVDSQQENTINQAQESYNNAVDTIIKVLTQVLDKGEITSEDNATILQAQSTISETEEQIKQVCNDYKNINITAQLENIKENMVGATIDDILNILTVNGTKPWLYKDSDNNVLVDSQSIPELTVLVNKLNMIATGGDDEAAEIQLTPEFINMVVQGSGASEGVKEVTTKYYLSTSKTELIGGTWVDKLPTVTEQQGKYLWYKIVTTYLDETKDPTETDPVCISAKDGKDGTGINIIDKLTSTSQLPATGKPGDCYTVNGVLYVWSADRSAWVDCGNIKGEQGEPGVSTYLHIKYSNDGKTFTANDGETVGIYMGILTDNTVADSTNFNDYTWSRIRGDQGLQGIQGEKGEQGIPGEKGDKGEQGQTTYFHIKYSSVANPTSSSQMTEVPSEYIGTYVDYTSTDSKDPSKYTWSRFQGLQGDKGDQGIPGENGSNGQTYYLHIKYSNDGGKTFTTNNGETPGDYIGVYTDTVQADSSSVNSYTWSKIKGDQGPQGVPGVPGKDGTTTYTWIKYADDVNGKNISNDPTNKLYIGFAYNKTTATESNNAGDYTWSLIKGDKGDTGVQGPKGEDGTSYYTWIKYSPESDGSNMTDIPYDYTKSRGFSGTISLAPSSGWKNLQLRANYLTGTLYIDNISVKLDGDANTNYASTKSLIIVGKDKNNQNTLIALTSTDNLKGKKFTVTFDYRIVGHTKAFNFCTQTKGDTSDGGTATWIKVGSDVDILENTEYIGIATNKTTATESTNKTNYVWSHFKGDQGTPGDDGRGVEEVIIQYAKNQSTTTAPTSGWSTSMPTYQEGYYLWMRTRIKYTDSADYVYSTPVCDQSWKAAQEVYTQYKQLSDKFTWIVSGGTSQSSMTLSDKMYELISKNITLTAEHINLNGYVSNDNANWSIDIDGNMETKNMNVEGDLSVNTISCNNLNSPKYPATLDGDIELYVNSESGKDEAELNDNAVYKTVQGAINALPKFLNGRTACITMQTNSTEDVYLKGFTGGVVRIYLNGKTLYGTFRTYVCSAAVYVYGGTKDSTEGATGIIHPNVGLAFATRSTSVGFESTQYGALYKVKVFAPDTNPSSISSTEKVCVASQSGTGSVYCKNVQIVNAVVGFRCNNHAAMHVNSSSGIASKYGFQCVTGGMMSLANNSQAGGSTENTNKSSGGQIWYDTSKVTFATGNQTTDSGSAPVVSGTKTITIKSSYGDTYRSSVYNNWKKDGTVRQGDYGYGDCTGVWFFGTAFSELKGKTITKVQITITRQQGGSSAPVEHKLWMHGHTGRPSGAPTLTSGWSQIFRLATGNSTPVAITDSTVLNAISAGTCKGFALRHTYDSVHYSVCSGNVTVKITYTE